MFFDKKVRVRLMQKGKKLGGLLVLYTSRLRFKVQGIDKFWQKAQASSFARINGILQQSEMTRRVTSGDVMMMIGACQDIMHQICISQAPLFFSQPCTPMLF